jgi:chromosome segregation ATPase
LSVALSQSAFAAQRQSNGNDKAIAKLQATVQSLTTERDSLKAQSAKSAADLEQAQAELKKQAEQVQQLEQEKAAALATGEQLNAELTNQKGTTLAVQGQLSSTSEKLRHVSMQYAELQKAAQTLQAEYNRLQNMQKNTANELGVCESKNLKMYETTKAMIDQYQSAEGRNMWDKVVSSEPLLRFNQVEVENLMQEYQDKLNKQKLKEKAQ